MPYLQCRVGSAAIVWLNAENISDNAATPKLNALVPIAAFSRRHWMLFWYLRLQVDYNWFTSSKMGEYAPNLSGKRCSLVTSPPPPVKFPLTSPCLKELWDAHCSSQGISLKTLETLTFGDPWQGWRIRILREREHALSGLHPRGGPVPLRKSWVHPCPLCTYASASLTAKSTPSKWKENWNTF